jgi:polynucleotide 5'-kinase involved in rRNA processing
MQEMEQNDGGKVQVPKEVENFITMFDYMKQEEVATAEGNHRRKERREFDTEIETNILFVGEEDSGKTSLINLFLGRKGKFMLVRRARGDI